MALLAASIPVMWVYLVGQRRAAVVGLVGGFVLFGVMLFWRQRRTFWKVVPVVTLVADGYDVAVMGRRESVLADAVTAIEAGGHQGTVVARAVAL